MACVFVGQVVQDVFVFLHLGFCLFFIEKARSRLLYITPFF